MKKLKVAILGSGNIGTDLLIKVLRSPLLDCQVLIGRNHNSNGLQKAASLGVTTSADSIQYIVKNPGSCDIVFDATSAKDHLIHAPVLKDLGKFVIDLTPACVGEICVPAVNLEQCISQPNVNMITCGGQASIPIAYAIAQIHNEIEYLEVVSSIASRGAGPATRLNIDEYIKTTEFGLQHFSGALKTKTILNLNPAVPCINMQTTIFAKVKNPNLPELQKQVTEITNKIKRYVPGYEIILNPMFENDRIVIMLRVKGLGDYLPEYAGNLDIINCAAIAVAEAYANSKLA